MLVLKNECILDYNQTINTHACFTVTTSNPLSVQKREDIVYVLTKTFSTRGLIFQNKTERKFIKWSTERGKELSELSIMV